MSFILCFFIDLIVIILPQDVIPIPFMRVVFWNDNKTFFASSLFARTRREAARALTAPTHTHTHTLSPSSGAAVAGKQKCHAPVLWG